MPDNVGYTPGTGATVAADEIGGVLFQRVKPTIGADGAAVDVSADNPMPVGAVGELIEALEAQRMALQALLRTMGQATPDTGGRLRVNVDFLNSSLTLWAVNSVNAVVNQTSMGGYAATEQIPSLMRMGADSLRRNISVT